MLVPRSREQIYEAFGEITLERMHEVTFIVRDSKKDKTNKEKEGGRHACHSNTDWEKGLVFAKSPTQMWKTTLQRRPWREHNLCWEQLRATNSLGGWLCHSTNKLNALPIIQIIVDLRPTHAKATLRERERPSEMDKNPRRRRACLCGHPVGDATGKRRGWRHLQSADRMTDTVWCSCVARPTE